MSIYVHEAQKGAFMNTNVRVRSPGLDLVRCFALFCVVSLHFFLYIKFDMIPNVDIAAYAVILLRSFFMICVPLFLMLSGYLLGDRKPSGKYYKKLGKTLFVYLAASVCCIAFSYAYQFLLEHQPVSLAEQMAGILSFSAAPYGWYMEMYLGLYLLIPFLNRCYNTLEDSKSKRWLVLTLLALTALPSVMNIYRFDDVQWWLQPSSSDSYVKLIPAFWESLYPLSYYFLGCYLREYPLKITRQQNLLLIGVVFFVSGSFNFYRSYPSGFIFGPWQGHASALVAAQSVLVFQWLVSADYGRLSESAQKRLAVLSDLCLGAYLVSWIFDRVVYYVLNRMVPAITDRLPFYFAAVPVVYVCSLALSAVINILYRVLFRRPGK